MEIIILLTAGAVALYLIWSWLLQKYTGCTAEEAGKKIQSFFSSEPPYSIATDQGMINELCGIIRHIIGEQAYQDLEKLSATVVLWWTNFMSGIPYIAFTVICPEYLRPRLTTVLAGALAKYLRMHGLPDKVVARWKENEQLGLPVIMLLYAETSQQERLLAGLQREEAMKTLGSYREVYDDDEEIRE